MFSGFGALGGITGTRGAPTKGPYVAVSVVFFVFVKALIIYYGLVTTFFAVAGAGATTGVFGVTAAKAGYFISSSVEITSVIDI